MKKLLLLLLITFTASAVAQTVNIPDADFKNKLLEAGISNNYATDADGNIIVIDINGDDEIQVTEALLVYGLDLTSTGAMLSLEGIQQFVNLESLLVTDCNVVDLPVAGMSNLHTLFCSNNQISVLDLSGLINLENLRCGNNDIAILNFDDTPNLQSLVCFENPLINLDCSNMPLLTNLEADQCPDLTMVNLKNGSDLPLNTLFLDNCPALSYVCADEDEVDYLMDYFESVSQTVSVSSYCSFTPGGDYNTINGTLTFDAGNDGCDDTDAVNSLVKVTITDGTEAGAVFTDLSGGYAFYTQDGAFTVTPEFENENYFTASPASAIINFPVVDNTVAVQDFCVTANGVNNDIEVVMVPVVPASPGFDAVYKIVYKNKGNQTLSGSITCGWDYSLLEFVSMAPLADVTGLGVYTWNFDNLQPFENRSIIMQLNVNSPTDVPAVNIDDVLPFTAVATIGETDIMPEDNTFLLNQVVVGSYDPNNIICIQGETAPPDTIGDYLHYVVNFENTATAPASFIVVEHEIDESQYDISTLQVLNTSHGMTARVNGNTIKFLFQDINLAAADHGNILFKLKTKNSLTAGEAVMQKANIFFDYNFPIETNEANTVFEILSRGNYEKDNSVKVYPNPSGGIVSITAASMIKSIQLYDIQGRLLQVKTGDSVSSAIDISSRQNGIYILKITTESGVKVEKLIKN